MLSINDKIFNVVKKIVTPIAIFGVIGLIIFAYLNNIEIDEGTPEMYKTINSLFVIFCITHHLFYIVRLKIKV